MDSSDQKTELWLCLLVATLQRWERNSQKPDRLRNGNFRLKQRNRQAFQIAAARFRLPRLSDRPVSWRMPTVIRMRGIEPSTSPDGIRLRASLRRPLRSRIAEVRDRSGSPSSVDDLAEPRSCAGHLSGSCPASSANSRRAALRQRQRSASAHQMLALRDAAIVSRALARRSDATASAISENSCAIRAVSAASQSNKPACLRARRSERAPSAY
jgi:hypothetical protein